MKIQDFDFGLPPELIAQFPSEQRASSRMLHLEASTAGLRDAMFADLPHDSAAEPLPPRALRTVARVAEQAWGNAVYERRF